MAELHRTQGHLPRNRPSRRPLAGANATFGSIGCAFLTAFSCGKIDYEDEFDEDDYTGGTPVSLCSLKRA